MASYFYFRSRKSSRTSLVVPQLARNSNSSTKKAHGISFAAMALWKKLVRKRRVVLEVQLRELSFYFQLQVFLYSPSFVFFFSVFIWIVPDVFAFGAWVDGARLGAKPGSRGMHPILLFPLGVDLETAIAHESQFRIGYISDGVDYIDAAYKIGK